MDLFNQSTVHLDFGPLIPPPPIYHMRTKEKPPYSLVTKPLQPKHVSLNVGILIQHFVSN